MGARRYLYLGGMRNINDAVPLPAIILGQFKNPDLMILLETPNLTDNFCLDAIEADYC